MENSILPKNEYIVYIARKMHWTKSEIYELTLPEFHALLDELYYQEAVEKYEQYSFYNVLLSEIHNAPITKPKIRKPKDYYQIELPLRDGETKKKQTDADMLAQVQVINAALGGNVVTRES